MHRASAPAGAVVVWRDRAVCLEAVDDDLGFGTDLLVREKVRDVGPLVPRELNDLAEFLVLGDRPVALKVLLEGFADPLDVQVVRESLDRRDAFSPVPLLHANVHLALVARRLVSVVEGIEVLQVLDVVTHNSLFFSLDIRRGCGGDDKEKDAAVDGAVCGGCWRGRGPATRVEQRVPRGRRGRGGCPLGRSDGAYHRRARAHDGGGRHRVGRRVVDVLGLARRVSVDLVCGLRPR
mmetsp:Transcript_20711/g.65113  ORF Transcript_20711/g.65113 Transcript_20711/m.65113 type:complete len:236 (+) Transcript_20711:75-782(+)